MNIVFFGTSEFAIPALRALVASSHKVLAVVTQPDRPRGRNLKVSPSPVKALAAASGLPVFQPVNASSAEAVDYLRKLGADIFVVISFGQILRQNILAIPRLYAVNVHGSLLPAYRGASPTNHAIINGDKASGVTIIRMNDKMDEGDIILKRETPIGSEDTNITLHERLSEIGASVLMELVDTLASGKAVAFEKQDDATATYAPKLKKEDGAIDWNEPAAKIHNKIRGLLPWPGAYTYYNGKILKVLKAAPVSSGAEAARPGEVVNISDDTGVVVRTGSGDIVMQYLQLEGKKDMASAAFVRGHRIARGYTFGK